ncbi:MAG: exodeoxyribonuclease VII large subunit [Bacteroidota bacterium]
MAEQVPFLFDIPSVSQLTDTIKKLLEQQFVDILVEGEASNVKQSSNGHIYFTLKDSGAQLPCVVWRSTAQRSGIQLADGQRIVVGGDIQVYAPHGRYQMIVNLVQQAGIGKLQQAFEQLKSKLQEEGLFEQIHKKALPPYPASIGVVTSATGAAFQDIRATLEQRWPLAEVHLYHASVQGVSAAPQLVQGIRHFNEHQPVDVLIIGRGGGSLEDLWPFNEEIVARAVFDSVFPVISAVGHEVDFSISDFVADARAATPTQAAVLATPDRNETRFLVEDLSRRLELNTVGAIQFYKEKIHNLGSSHALQVVKQKLALASLRVDRCKEQLSSLSTYQIQKKSQLFLNLNHKLEKSNPNIPLEQGFTRIWQDKKWIRSTDDMDGKSAFDIEWANGKQTIVR